MRAARGKRSGAETRRARRTIETAVFLDAKAYNMYARYFSGVCVVLTIKTRKYQRLIVGGEVVKKKRY